MEIYPLHESLKMLSLGEIICCPRCRSALIENAQGDDEAAETMLYCVNKDCGRVLAQAGFPLMPNVDRI